ncbi:MAG TPA: hypothetical protein VMV10_20815 [Pirellulales bacterium]|nr:hypothetical protein [Pirellulales bacterium]
MDELDELTKRAEALRARIAAFLREFGELTPELRELQEILAQIQQHLKALAKLEQDEKEEG